MSAKLVDTIANRLKEAMRDKGNMSQAELARETGIDRSSISLYLSGKYSPKGDKLYILANALNVSVAWLAGFDAPKKDKKLADNIIPLPKTKRVPLLGTIACGEPILATENIDKYIEMPESVGGTFALKCKGDSMINARIFDGDIVYIREQPDVENGEIAAVLIGDEATLKRVYKSPTKVILHPENPLYKDMVFVEEEMNEVRIIGKAIAFLSAAR